MTPDRILVTGATGFVGRHLVRHLLDAGRSVTVAVRSAAACPPAWRGSGAIRIVETGPLETATNLDAALAQVSTIVHLAGLAHVHGSDGDGGEDAFMTANAQATARLAETAAVHRGIRTFVLLSSLGAVTGNAAEIRIDDTTPPTPTTAYGRSKLEAERHVLALASKGVVPVCLRPPLVVGADAAGNWCMMLRLAATGLPLPFASVRNRRSMIGVGSLVEAIALLCTREWPVETAGAYAIADPQPVSLAQIVRELRTGMGLPSRLVPFPPSLLYGLAALVRQQRRAAGLLGSLEVDGNRFMDSFGFQPSRDLPAQIREAGAGWRAARNKRNQL